MFEFSILNKKYKFKEYHFIYNYYHDVIAVCEPHPTEEPTSVKCCLTALSKIAYKKTNYYKLVIKKIFIL